MLEIDIMETVKYFCGYNVIEGSWSLMKQLIFLHLLSNIVLL